MRPQLTTEQRVKLALPMVEQCAEELARLFNPVTRDELLGPGTIGAHEAAEKYREEKHPYFVVYARHYIRGRMLDAIRVEHRALRARVERAMERAYDGFSAHEAETVDTFADPPEKILEGARQGHDDALAAAFFASMMEMRGASAEEIHAELEGQAEILGHLGDAMATLYPHEREVIQRVYVEDLTLDDVAALIGMSQNTVQRRHVAALRKLREFLLSRGVNAPALLGR